MGAAALLFSDVGDVTTLANPEVVEQIRELVQSEKRARGEQPKDLSQREKGEIETFGQASE
jgi:acetyl-CoA synthetase